MNETVMSDLNIEVENLARKNEGEADYETCSYTALLVIIAELRKLNEVKQ